MLRVGVDRENFTKLPQIYSFIFLYSGDNMLQINIFDGPITTNDYPRSNRPTTLVIRNHIFEVVIPNINSIESKLVSIIFQLSYANMLLLII